jgi:biopolymer transport protein ExbD
VLFGSQGLASLDELTARLNRVAQEQPNAEVILRADRRLPYGQVKRVMTLISAANLSRVQVVTELGSRT